MSYDPTQWKSGDVVTSAKLNKMEQGIAAANESTSQIYEIEVTAGEETQDIDNKDSVTYNNLLADITAGKNVWVKLTTILDGETTVIYMSPIFGVDGFNQRYVLILPTASTIGEDIALYASDPDVPFGLGGDIGESVINNPTI